MGQAKKTDQATKKVALRGVAPSQRLETLLAWQAPERVFKQRSKEFWSTILSIIFLISVVLFLAQEYLLIATIFALTFFYYILSTNPPQDIECKITNRGFVWGSQKFKWITLRRFWFTKEDGQNILNIETTLDIPRRLIVLLGKQNPKTVGKILENFLPHEKVAPSFIERATRWLGKTFPLEPETKKEKAKASANSKRTS